MVARVKTVAFQGIDCREVDVEVQLGPGLPAFTVVGLADKAVGESRERVRAALAAIGLALPPQRITVNLAPADLPKEGSHFDLPIALGHAGGDGRAAGRRAGRITSRWANWRSTAGSTRWRACCRRRLPRRRAGRGLICPAAQGGEAAWAGDLAVLAPASLIALVNHFKGSQTLSQPVAQMEALADPRRSTSPTSRARRAPSARWKWRQPAAIIC